MVATFSRDRHSPRLGLITTSSRDATILSPQGQHLRWFVPSRLGFPRGGFDVWRINTNAWATALRKYVQKGQLDGRTPWQKQLNWSGRDRHHVIHQDAVIITRSDATLIPKPSGLVVESPGSAEHLLLHFRQAVIRVEITIDPARDARRQPTPGPAGRRGRSSKPLADVWHQSVPIGSWPLEEKLVIEHPAITDVLLPIHYIGSITSVRFVTESGAAEAVQRNGDLLSHIDLPDSIAAAYSLANVGRGISHRYFSGATKQKLLDTYPADRVLDLIKSVQSTVNAPDRKINAPGSPGMSPSEIRVLDMVELAAVDPTIAHMLGCYFVDLKPGPGLYFVRGDYQNNKKTVVYGFAFTRDAAAQPKLPSIKVAQLSGITFDQQRPLGRVGLSWSVPRLALRAPSRATLVDVTRIDTSGKTRLTARPHLVRRDSAPQFIDEKVELPNDVAYELIPIDLFGRSGKPVKTKTIAVKDMGRPVPPRLVRATLNQYGAPWQNPHALQASDQRGHIDASAEFGEGQTITSPDAAKLHWGYRIGPHGAQDRNPQSWTLLHSSAAVTASHTKVQWPELSRLTRYRLPVAGIVNTDMAKQSGLLGRLDSIRQRPEDTVTSVPTREILLNTAVLEPNVFAGHRITGTPQPVTVIDSTAGIALDDDHSGDKQLTARLFVAADSNLAGIGQSLVLEHPSGAQWQPGVQQPPPLIAVPLPLESGTSDRAQGGEVALEFGQRLQAGVVNPAIEIIDISASNANNHVVTGRVVADFVLNGERSTLLRMPTESADRLLQLERMGNKALMRARHHRPYLMKRCAIGIDGAPGDIQIDFSPQQRFETLWITSWTEDSAGLLSLETATPFELRVVRPPVAATMSAPFPTDAPAATRAQLSPPDRHGESLARVAWEPAGDNTGAVRYELSRAPGSTIIATESARWQRGADGSAAEALGAIAGPKVELTPHATVEALHNGTVRFTIANPGEAKQGILEAIKKGRVRVTHPLATGTRELSHRFVRASVQLDGSNEIVVRPFVDAALLVQAGIDVNFNCHVESLPDYSAIITDSEHLRQLADVEDTNGNGNDQAFGVVTGVPISALQFVDRLPGMGRSRFYYKVRIVFQSESRSAWSPASVAFHQLNSARAEPPHSWAVHLHDNEALVSFELPDDPDLTGVRVMASTSTADYLIQPAAGQLPVAGARIAANGRVLDLRSVLETFEGDVEIFPADVDTNNPGTPLDSGMLIRGIFDLSTPRSNEPLAIKHTTVAGSSWFNQIPERYEIVISADANNVEPQPSVWTLQTLKRIPVRGNWVDRHSEPIVVEVRGVNDAID